MFTVSGLRTGRGIRMGAPMEAKVSPGTPPTASRPVTRSGCSTATSNIVFTPIDQPISTHDVEPGVVHHRDRVLGEGVDADVLEVAGPLRATDAAVVPGDHPDAARRVEQGRPGVRVGTQAVAQQDRGPLDVVGPGLQDGAVAAGHGVVAQGETVVGGRGDAQGGR